VLPSAPDPGCLGGVFACPGGRVPPGVIAEPEQILNGHIALLPLLEEVPGHTLLQGQ
jgi:hypothetical protein